MPFPTAGLLVVSSKANTCLRKIKILVNPGAKLQTEKLSGQFGNLIWTYSLPDCHFFMGLDFSLCEFRLRYACIFLYFL